MRFQGRTIEFKLLMGYSIILVALVASIIFVLQIQLRSRLEAQTLKQVETNGEIIVAELVRRTTLVNTLAQSLSNFSSTPGLSSDILMSTLPRLIDLPESQTFIAGGGYWPEPYAFSSKLERSSFFWGRDSQGVLEYFDDYNAADGPGYHNEEWYVPARYLTEGKCYWSRSYTDPYSGQPMVTCTVAATKNKQFIGAATIDLKLDGLAEFFSQQTKSTGGYAFAVDQHNRFISFPNQNTITRKNGAITASQLAEFSSDFVIVASALSGLSADLKNMSKDNSAHDTKLAIDISDESYQIGPDEAEIIAAALRDPLKDKPSNSLLLKRIEVDNDIILGESSTASIFHVPGAYWKVVVVTPKRVALSNVSVFVEESLKNLLIPMLAIMGLAFVGMRVVILKPISNITNTLRSSVEKGGFKFNALDENRKDEFGQLAYWYNLKNTELNEAMIKLSDVNEELSHHANFDALTDLSNRRDFEKKLNALMSGGLWGKHSLLYIDIDQFKLVNDTCGHIAGDQLLIQISAILSKMLRDGDSVARIGGDEFAIIAKTSSHDSVEIIAGRVIKNMADMVFNWEGAKFNITCSIGVLFLDDILADTTQAMKLVDTACYAAKEAGRNRYHLYRQDDLASQRVGEMSWIARINNAFDNDLFVNEFQVIAPSTLDSGSLCCIESLIRMKNDEGGLIPPGAFLPAAERYNAISRIDRWVIKNTLSLLNENRVIINKIKFCSINLSGDSICSEGLIEYISDCMAEFSIPANKLCFEVTETQAMLNMQSAAGFLAKLKELGCLIALDDFGSGMSSYGYLTQLPVNYLKIDGSFVRNITEDSVSLAFVKSMGDIAKAMGLQTIAEFVEDIDTYHLLKGLGIDYAQGYGIAKPLPIKSVIRYLEDKNQMPLVSAGR